MSLITLEQIGWLNIILIARIKRLIIQHLWDILKITMKILNEKCYLCTQPAYIIDITYVMWYVLNGGD